MFITSTPQEFYDDGVQYMEVRSVLAPMCLDLYGACKQVGTFLRLAIRLWTLLKVKNANMGSNHDK